MGYYAVAGICKGQQREMKMSRSAFLVIGAFAASAVVAHAEEIRVNLNKADIAVVATLHQATEGETSPPSGAEPLDDGGGGHAAALAHRLQAVAAARALQLV